ncbi:NADH:quinone oxidoreductase [Pseudomonas sp. PB120]|uniref:Rnf-Nqr domain containing protein n=1 Tax=Pseudomonas sp. PB120 TaxID=2494700 RepID=UPI0012FD8281|nr:Rnf-Nqr domain containing protein [Pseudomonas sp. PB120]MVV52105.1 NADH:quinone oxidoreductase [Pseudomonas sp. PB120]
MNKLSPMHNTLMLAPLIGATGSWVTALSLWLMFIVVINAFGVCMGTLRSRLAPATHLLAGVLLAATLTSGAELAVQALSLQVQQHLGFYAGLIALQCVVLEHTGFFHSPWRDRLSLCAVFGVLMTSMGLLRELLGNSGFHLATLAPGGFILLGLLLAGWQACTRPTPSQ